MKSQVSTLQAANKAIKNRPQKAWAGLTNARLLCECYAIKGRYRMFDKPILFLATSNQAESKEFYENKMGLDFVSSDPYALVFNVGKSQLRIQVVNSVITSPYTSLGWSVTDLEKTIKRLSSNGVKFETYENLEQDMHGIWHSPSGAKIAWFKDPDNNILSLTEL